MADELIVRYTLRTDRELFRKFRYIAGSEGRSVNKTIEQYMIQRVKEYEAEFGNIHITEKDKK